MTNDRPVVNVSDLREILQYVPRFRERVFVVAVDGEVAASENFANVLLPSKNPDPLPANVVTTPAGVTFRI